MIFRGSFETGKYCRNSVFKILWKSGKLILTNKFLKSYAFRFKTILCLNFAKSSLFSLSHSFFFFKFSYHTLGIGDFRNCSKIQHTIFDEFGM